MFECFNPCDIKMSVALESFINHMFDFGHNREFKIQDVQEASSDPNEDFLKRFARPDDKFWLAKIHAEASDLRAKHGNFFIRTYGE